MAEAIFSVLLATTNRGKLAELRELLADLPIELLTLDQALPGSPPVEETGATLEENALIKARAATDALTVPLVTIAEDSGLEVDALGGRPGVRSARFAREGATDTENIEALLTALEKVEDDQRSARFRCVMVLVDPFRAKDPMSIVEGRCEGSIVGSPRGAGGFGYDPLFVLADPSANGRTMAEITPAQKNVLSHRAKAIAKLRPLLASMIEERLASAQRIAAADSSKPSAS